jgi:hypothetical protein
MNLFKKATASVALVSLVSGVFSSGVAAMNLAEIEAATSLANKGVINKVDTVADFRLDATITRAEAAKVAAEIAGIEPNSSCEGKFSDVSATTPNTWVCGYVEALLEAGKLSANENYNPERNLSKTESLKMMLEAAGDEVVYDNATWQADFVAHAVANAYISTFTDYNTAATRGFVFVAADAAHEANSDDNILDDILNEIEGGDDDTTTDNGDDTTPVVVGDKELSVTLSPETPENGNIAAGVSRTAVLAFDVTAGSVDVTLKEATLEFTGLGDADVMDNLAFYIGNNKVTKQDSRGFDSENEAKLSFEKNTVVKAGETKTIVVTSTIASTAADTLQSLRVSLANLEASEEVVGDELNGATLTPIAVKNKATVEIDDDTASDDVVVGEVVTLAGFELEEKSDKEDAIVKAITFTVSGSIDAEDDLTDLVLLADGEEVATDLYVNSDDEIVVDLEYVIPADESVDFELQGVVTGSIGQDIEMVFANSDDIYVVGATTGISLDVAGVTSADIADAVVIEGSEINVAFDKSSIDEVKPNAEKALIGTLTMSTSEDYTIDVIEVTIKNTTFATKSTAVQDIISELELDGTSFDSASTGSTAVYTFEDITLSDEEKVLELRADIEDETSLNGINLTFDVAITKVTDEENDETYTTKVGDVLSSTSFKTKSIDVESASFELTASNVTDRELVLGNGIEVVLYKGKISVGDSDDIKINEISFTGGATSLSNSADLEDVLDNVEINIGGKTKDGDVKATVVEFKSLNTIVAAGSDNVEVLVTGTLKDDDSIQSLDQIELAYNSAALDIEDSEGEEVLNITDSSANTYNPTIVLNEQGSLEIAVVNNGENEDEIEAVVLAGTNGVALAEVEMEASDEDIKVKELAFTIAGADFSPTLENVKLVAGSKTIAEGAVVTYNGTDTLITFKDDFIVEESEDLIEAVLVADLNTVTTEGGQVSATLGDVQIELVALVASDVKGVSSNEDITVDYDMSSNVDNNVSASATSDVVTVVPALVTVSVVNTLGNEDQYARIKFDIDKGNNDLDSDDVTITQIDLENAVAGSGVVLRNDDNADVAFVDENADPLVLSTAEEINDGDEFEFKVTGDNDEIRIVANGISFMIDNKTYTISNDKVIDLGSYTTE